jgi:GMP synthase (glutamine-hydrolysing)
VLRNLTRDTPSRRRSAIAIRHVAFENLGFLSAILDEAGWTVSYCDAAVSDLTDPVLQKADLLIVLGGPIGVYDSQPYPFLLHEIALLERRLARDRPTLGICLGSQLMARALGARVYPGPVKEIGWGKLMLTPEGRASCLQHLAESGEVLHWHGDTFELPTDAVRLASTAHYDNQAFAWRSSGLALQFHLEADTRRLEEWYVGHCAELAAARIDIPALRSATLRVSQFARQQADAVFGEWLSGLA